MTKITDLVAEDSDFLLQSERAAANGVASLDGGGKIPIAQLPTLAGTLDFKGTWNANTNSPSLSDGSGAEAGDFYIVSDNGSTSLDGISEWKAGDWVIDDGTVWRKIDNTEPIASVFGRTGVVLPVANDYDADEIDETGTTNKFTTAGDITKLAAIEASADVTDAANVDAAGAALEADWDANTLLVANDDNTPLPLSMAASRILGRKSSGNIGALTAAEILTIINVAAGANLYVHPNHSGDVTSVADGAQTIVANAVTNAKLADMEAYTVKLRNSNSTGNPGNVKISALTEEASPAAGDWCLVEESGGALKKVDLGNLTAPVGDSWGDVVDAVITPDADGTRDIGTTGTRFREAFLDALNITNNIVVGGTVDGRDVAADGTTLDAIEASATADQSDAEIKTAYENNADTNEFSDAEQTSLATMEDNADVTDAANVVSSLSGATLSGGLNFGGNTALDAAVGIVTYTNDQIAVIGDAGKYVRMNKASSVNYTIPPNVDVAFATGTKIHVRNTGAGAVTIVEGTAVTISTPETLVLAKQHATVTLVKTGTNAWDVMGNLTAA